MQRSKPGIRTMYQGCKINMAISLFSLSEIRKNPTHILSNSASYIDLIFTSQPNLVMHSGVHPSLKPNCHHQITFAKFSFTTLYPPTRKRLVWQIINLSLTPKKEPNL